MHKIEARAGQLVRWNAKQGGRYVQTSAIEIAKELEHRIGKIYGIVIADAPAKAGEALFAHIEDSLGRGTLEAARRCPADATHEQLFESAISQVNQAVARVLGEHGLGVEPEFVSAAVVAVHGHDVVAAIWGQPTILLYHPTSAGMSAYDLVDAEAPQGASAQRRCFGSVISGRIGPEDRLLLATQDVRELLGDDVTADAMSAEDPGMATKLLRDALAPLEEELTIAVLAIDVAPVRYIEEMPGRTVTTQSSLADLRRMESRTEEIMSPSPLAALQKGLGSAASAVRGNREAKPSQAAPTPTPSRPQAVPRKQISVSGVIFGFIASIFRGVFRLLKAAFTMNWRTAPKDAVAKIDGFFNGLISKFNGLAPLRKKILLGIMVAMMALNTSVLASSLKTNLDDFASASERRAVAIRQKVDAAEASMIYRDEARAKTLLAEAETDTAALPARSAKDKAAKSDLEARIVAARANMRHAVALGQPEILATVAVSTAGDMPQLSRLASVSGALWSVSAKGELFRISTADGAAQKAGDIAGQPKVVLSIGTNVLAASGSGSGQLIPASGKGAGKAVNIDTNGADIADAATWNGNLYVLDPLHNRILRHAAVADGFGAPAFYLKDGTDVTKGVSMAIDGAVWVLGTDGSVTHLLKGSHDAFGVASVEPPIAAALRLRTTPESESLYVLDANPARIIRFSKKTGSLVAQYESPAFAGATDFTVDEAAKTLLVSVGNQVLRFALPQ